MTRRLVSTLALVSLLTVTMAGTALAYDYPSTNDANRANGWPHVNLVAADFDSITLEFVNDTNSLAFFEVRIDGEMLTSGTPHPVVTGDYIYSGVTVDGRGAAEPVAVEQQFEAAATVEVRLALGGERDWDFDWVTFEVNAPESKDECRNSYADYGFKNVGLCIKYLQTGG